MANAFAAHLPHFRTEAFAGVGPGRLTPLGPPARDPERDAEQAAIARACEAAVAEARAGFEAVRARDLAGFECSLAESERRFSEATADVLAERLKAGLDEIATALNIHVARVLARFLGEAIRARALGELAETVAALLAARPAARVRVSGPQALVERLRDRLATAGSPVDVVTDPGMADVTVTLDDTMVETRIADWMDRIERANGGAHV